MYKIKTNMITSPEDMINIVLCHKKIYVIKLKCFGCSETNFMNVSDEDIKRAGNVFMIKTKKYPIKLIESVTIRVFDDDLEIKKQEFCYQVSGLYIRDFFQEEIIKELNKFGL